MTEPETIKFVRELTKAIEANPSEASNYFSRGKLYIETGEYERALADFNAAVNLGYRDAEMFYYRGITFLEKKLFENAIEDFSAAINLNYVLLPIVYFKRGSAHVANSDYQSAILDYSKVIESHLKNLDLKDLRLKAYILRSRLYEKIGLIDNAKNDIEKAKSLSDSIGYFICPNCKQFVLAKEKAGMKVCRYCNCILVGLSEKREPIVFQKKIKFFDLNNLVGAIASVAVIYCLFLGSVWLYLSQPEYIKIKFIPLYFLGKIIDDLILPFTARDIFIIVFGSALFFISCIFAIYWSRLKEFKKYQVYYNEFWDKLLQS